MITSLRQWFYPKEFRIKGYGVSLKNLDLSEEINRLEEIIKKLADSGQADTGFIREIATSVWRLEKRMEYVADHSKVTKVTNAVNLMKDILKKQKIQIEDYTGKTWGSPVIESTVVVIGGDPTGIIRMVEPRIFYDGKILQHGKVVIEQKEDKE